MTSIKDLAEKTKKGVESISFADINQAIQSAQVKDRDTLVKECRKLANASEYNKLDGVLALILFNFMQAKGE